MLGKLVFHPAILPAPLIRDGAITGQGICHRYRGRRVARSCVGRPASTRDVHGVRWKIVPPIHLIARMASIRAFWSSDKVSGGCGRNLLATTRGPQGHPHLWAQQVEDKERLCGRGRPRRMPWEKMAGRGWKQGRRWMCTAAMILTHQCHRRIGQCRSS